MASLLLAFLNQANLNVYLTETFLYIEQISDPCAHNLVFIKKLDTEVMHPIIKV